MNGEFPPKYNIYGAEYPVGYTFFMYSSQHPLKTTTGLLASAVTSLLEQNGFRQAQVKPRELSGLFERGLSLSENEFVVQTYGQSDSIAQVDIITPLSASAHAFETMRRASATQIDNATLHALKRHGLTP